MQEALIIGGGPAGLMAAEVLSGGGAEVVLCDAMPSVGRKFLLAGRGGLNLTHAEPLPRFVSRYGDEAERFAGLLAEFGPEALRAWAAGLGIQTFVGSSGRVFPESFKAAPLLRAWVRRLRQQGVRFLPRHRWSGLSDNGDWRFLTPDGETGIPSRVTVLALGGASWPRLGSDGAWVPLLQELGCPVTPLRPANCGFLAAWPPAMAGQFGAPVKNLALSFGGQRMAGELIITPYGLEGGAVYALSAALREAIASHGEARLEIDLKPDLDAEALALRLSRPRGRLSLSNWLRKTVGLTPPAIALLRQAASPPELADPQRLALRLKTVGITLTAPRPLDEAISTAGGVSFATLDDRLMVRRRPGLFIAGEMLDWEAPTGGYLLTGCFATGHRAGRAALAWLSARKSDVREDSLSV